MNPQILFLSADIPSGRVFGLDQQTLIQIGIQLLNSGVLAAVLAIILYKPVRAFMRGRADKIKAQLDHAVEDMQRADELKCQYEEKLRDVEAERERILEQARELASEKSRQLLAEAKSEADMIRNRALHDMEMEQQRVKDEIGQYILEASSLMAEKFVTVSIDKETQDRLFAETMAELEETTWQS